MTARSIERRNRVIDMMGDRVVHYSEVAKFLCLTGSTAHQLLRYMESERLVTKVVTSKWRATGRRAEQELDRVRARPEHVGVPLLAQVW